MASVNVLNISVLNNPASFTSAFEFEITFDCASELSDDLEWKVVYVGSAESDKHDQELDTVLVGPVPVGVNKFVMQTAAPNPALIPKTDVLGVTVVLITCSYKGQEFIRVGYYVNNEWGEELPEGAEPPEDLEPSKVVRNILAEKPRVTRFPIDWE